MTKEELIQSFYQVFGKRGGAPVTVFSPGRVNLIGEHTDYNGGHVFPAALTIGTYFAARKRKDRVLRFFSGNFPKNGIVERTLDKPEFDAKKGFSNYLMGMVWAYEKRLGLTADAGMDLYLWGNIPNASGLSSSASVEVGMGKILNVLFGFDVPNLEVALTGQYAENRYNGVNCGIMDQFAIAMGKKDQAMFLDTATLNFQYVPVVLSGMKIVISCTNKKRGLADSKYNERRSECETALAELRTKKDVQSLGELTPEEFEAIKDAIRDPVRMCRARHAVYENERTVKAVGLLNAGDIEGFGKLMNASHVSLRDDYEVTGIELDTLAEESWKIDGVIGARMTGAGFGGCAVAIVKDEAVETYIEKVGAAYEAKIGYPASFYVVEIGDGTDVY
ncbi:MAG: galactokinase [Lachnospiraceae bacterium]|nr:galactokinase [Lachnospiraceae bacterium]